MRKGGAVVCPYARQSGLVTPWQLPARHCRWPHKHGKFAAATFLGNLSG
jgi:hypothetical protein